MARIAGVVLPDKKRIIVGLTYIYGVGPTRAKKILEQVKIDESKRVKDLKPEEEQKIREALALFKTEGELRREIQQNVKRLQDINSYRGMRHKRRLPARGQRTKTNARTKRGKRMTMGSGKIKEAKK